MDGRDTAIEGENVSEHDSSYGISGFKERGIVRNVINSKEDFRFHVVSLSLSELTLPDWFGEVKAFPTAERYCGMRSPPLVSAYIFGKEAFQTPITPATVYFQPIGYLPSNSCREDQNLWPTEGNVSVRSDEVLVVLGEKGLPVIESANELVHTVSLPF